MTKAELKPAINNVSNA